MLMQRLTLGTAAAVAAAFALAGCASDAVEPASTVDSISSGITGTPEPSSAADPDAADPDVKRKALERAQLALEKEKNEPPRRFTACLNDDGTLAATVHGTPGVGAPELKPYTPQEKKAVCDELKKERDAKK